MSEAAKPRKKRWVATLAILSVLIATVALALRWQESAIRAQGRVRLEQLLASLLQGQVHIDRVAALSFGGVRAEGVTVLDPKGRRVLHAKQLSLGLNVYALLHGRLHFTHGQMTDVQLLGIPSPNAAITLFDALSPKPSSQPSEPGASWLSIIFDHIHVQRADLVGDVPGLSKLHAKDIEAHGRIAVDDRLRVSISQARAQLVAPYERPITLEHATLSLLAGPLQIEGHFRVSQRRDQLRASLSYRAPEKGDDALDMVFDLAPVSSDLLTNIGVTAALVLVPDVRGSARLTGPTRALSYRAALETDAGRVAVVGSFPEDGGVDVRFSSPLIRVAELIAYAPPIELTLSVHAQRAAQENMGVAISVPSFSVFGVRMTDAHVSGHYEGDRFHFNNARVAYAGGRFNIAGWVDNDADLYVRVISRVPDLARDPTARRNGISAGLETNVLVARAADDLSFEGKIGLSNFSYKELSADTLSLEGEAEFTDDFSRPKLRLTARGTGVVIAGYPLGELTFRGTGLRGMYDGRVTARGADGRSASLDLQLQERNGRHRFIANRFELALPGRAPWHAHADVTLSDDGVTITELELASGAQHLAMAGDFSYSREYRVEAALKNFDLGGLRELTGVDLADLDGTVAGTLTLSGVPKHPRIDAKGTLRDGVFLGMKDLSVDLSLVFVEGRFEIDTAIILPDKSRIAIFTGGEPGEGATWIEQIERGNYQFKLDFQDVPFAVSKPWLAWRNIEPPPGTISAKVRGAGTFSDPQIDITSNVRGLVIGQYPPLDVDLALAHDGTVLTLHELSVRDPLGKLVSVNGHIQSEIGELVVLDRLRASLTQRPFELTIQTPRRRLDELPLPIRIDVPFPALLTAKLAQSDRGPTLDVTAQLGFPEPGTGVASCDGTFRRPELLLAFKAAQNKASGTLDVQLDDEPLGQAKLEADMPLSAWLTGEQPFSLPRTGFTMNLATAASEDMPVLCNFIAGPVVIEAAAEDAFAQPPKLKARLQTDALQLSPHESQRQRLGNLRNLHTMGAPFAADLSLIVDAQHITFRGRIEEESKGNLLVEGQLPSALFLPPNQRTGSLPVEIKLQANRLELSPLTVALPVAVRTAGLLDGQARLRFDIANPQVTLDGALRLSKGAIGIAPLGQQLSDVSAQIKLHGNVLHIESFSVRDFDGTASAQGDLTFETPSKLRADMIFNLSDFPIRNEGAQVSKLTGKLAFRSQIDDKAARSELVVKDLRINLPSDLGLGLQDLEPHSDIAVVGELPLPVPEAPYIFELRILADKPPFRVLRSDLNAEVRADLLVRYVNPTLSLQGSAELKRGNFELYGRRFELQESRLAFDHEDQLDPLVSLYATHKIGNHEIGVRVEGRLSDPKVSFTHSNPAITDTGTIIAQLLGVRNTDPTQQNRDASGAAAGILAGATAGLLTERVRREFGGVVPVVSMDSSGRTLRATRIRAGVQLDQLIERRLGGLRKVVRGAYIEGFVAPGSSSSQTDSPNAPPQSRGGGLLELRFPADLVGTVEYRPVQNWRVDVAYEP